jgi:hypothetical protein
MANIVLRSVKGSPLSIAEADSNLFNLNTEVGQKLDFTAYTADDILTKIKTVDGIGSGLDADTLDGNHATITNDVNRIVARDSTGSIFVQDITADGTVYANVTGNIIGNLTGDVTGNATNVAGIVALSNGGTGGTTMETARNGLGLGSISTQSASAVAISGGTITGITDLTIEDGGTGASNATAARANLGLTIGSDVQPYHPTLSALTVATGTASGNGIFVRTSSGAVSVRTFVAGTNISSITNADGVAGNPTINGSTGPSVTNIIKTGSTGVGDIGQSGNRFATIYGTATSAVYADLAEKYLSDAEYPIGTVMMVGGEAEVTASVWGRRAIGVVSENPAYIMNDALVGGTAIALKGRVPVRVIGSITKGDKIVAANGGMASAGVQHATDVIGIALETNSDVSEKLVECVIL